MKISPEINAASIVLAGHFNPMIFHPSWFVEHEIISKEEANAANTEIVHPEISKFDIEWLSIRVEKSLFIAETKMPPLIRVSDFIVKKNRVLFNAYSCKPCWNKQNGTF